VIAAALLLFVAHPAVAELAAGARAPRSPWSVNAAYYGETLTHPGLTVGVERELEFWGRRFGLVEHGFFVGADAGAWWHARHAVVAFADVVVGYRLVFPRGFRLEALGGLGYLHAFAAGPVYAIGEDGAARRTIDGGRPGLMLTGSLGLGWDFSVLGIAPLSVFLRAGVLGQYPYNTAWLPHLQGQLGVSIPLGGAS
jgi:hypothetical protein